MPKNDTYDLNEESDLNDQKWPKMTKSNQKWPKTTKKWLKITPDNPKWPKTTQKSKVLRTDRPTDRPTDGVGCRVACTRLKIQFRLIAWQSKLNAQRIKLGAADNVWFWLNSRARSIRRGDQDARFGIQVSQSLTAIGRTSLNACNTIINLTWLSLYVKRWPFTLWAQRVRNNSRM